MSARTTITFRFKPNGILTDATAATLKDADNTYGVKRKDTGAVVIAAGTTMDHIGVGVYAFTFTDPALNLSYDYVVCVHYVGETYYLPGEAAGNVTETTETTEGPYLTTVAEAKQIIRVGSGVVDSQVADMLRGAEDWVARRVGTTFAVTAQSEDHDGGYAELTPNVLPVVEIGSITDAETGAVVDPSLYRLVSKRTRIQRIGGEWPEGSERYRVEYTAGYNNGDVAKPDNSRAADPMLKYAVLALARRMYEVRGGQTTQSGQGFSIGWDKLAEGEIAEILSPCIFKRL